MNLRKIIVLFGLSMSLAPFAGGCQSGGVGDPCTPEDEYQRSFSGFSASELNVESRSFQCETRVCLVNHFRGRVSCPLGQSEEVTDGLLKTLGKIGDDQSGPFTKKLGKDITAVALNDAKACRVPGSSGAKAEAIEVPVNPQCETRPAKDSVYCSCRCDGPDKNAKYCECPSGYFCKELKELTLGAAVAQGSAQLSGSYCVKETKLERDAANTGEFPKICTQQRTTDQAAEPCTDAGNCDGVTTNP